MPLSYKHVGSKIPAKIQTYILTRADYLSLFAMRYPVKEEIHQTAEIFSKSWIRDFLKPHKMSALLNNFFFIVSKGGPKEKKPPKPMHSFGNFSAFFLWVPPWKL
jgi:hypothetical protein